MPGTVPHFISGEVLDSASQGSPPLWAEPGGWGCHTGEKWPAVGDLVGEEVLRGKTSRKPPARILYLLKIDSPRLPSLKPPESPSQESFRHLSSSPQRTCAIFVSVPEIYRD